MGLKIVMLFLAVMLTVFAVSCAEFPSRQLTMDVSSQSTPVMLTDTPTGASVPLSFESGYNSVSVTSSNNVSGVTVSSTATSTADINQPLSQQLGVAFIQNPQFIVVSSLQLGTERFQSFYLNTTKYLLTLKITIPKAAK